jgi:hypothetical protein
MAASDAIHTAATHHVATFFVTQYSNAQSLASLTPGRYRGTRSRANWSITVGSRDSYQVTTTEAAVRDTYQVTTADAAVMGTRIGNS